VRDCDVSMQQAPGSPHRARARPSTPKHLFRETSRCRWHLLGTCTRTEVPDGAPDFSCEADSDDGIVWALDGGTEAVPERVLPAERRARSGIYCWPSVGLDTMSPRSDFAEREDIEWEFRRQKTGAAGRLVRYELPDNPRFDIKLRGGCGQRVMVAAVADHGKAYRAGVKAGDVLVSIGGDREFASQSAVEVQASLVAPVVLVFLGFIGKLQAEVRMKCPETTYGFSSHAVAPRGMEDSIAVVDEVCFNPLTPASAIIYQKCRLIDDEESTTATTDEDDIACAELPEHIPSHDFMRRAMSRVARSLTDEDVGPACRVCEVAEEKTVFV